MDETAGGCRLSLGGWVYGEGPTLQEASDDLVVRLLNLAICFRASGFTVSSESPLPERGWLDFVWELGELAVRGEDIRGRVFDSQP